ncbi:MAG: hypothetical protein AAB947_02075 [Patescibacteria group bacterium]
MKIGREHFACIVAKSTSLEVLCNKKAIFAAGTNMAAKKSPTIKNMGIQFMTTSHHSHVYCVTRGMRSPAIIISAV